MADNTKLTGFWRDNFSVGSNGNSLFQEISFAAPVNTGNTFTWFGGGTSTRFKVVEGVGGSPDTSLEEVGNDQTLDAGVTVEQGVGTISTVSFSAGADIATGWRLEVEDAAGEIYFLSSVAFGTKGSGNNPVHLLVWHDKKIPADGAVLTVIQRVNGVAPNGIPYVCFTRGTMISTGTGSRPIEALRLGDLVQTADNGLQPLRWIGRKQFLGVHLRMNPRARPILVREGVLGAERDMLLSPHHRLVVGGAEAQLNFGTAEVMAAAKDLVNGEGILNVSPVEGVEYFHLAFDRYEVIFADGLRSESLLLGKYGLEGIGDAGRAELALLGLASEARAVPARPLLRGREGRYLGRRTRVGLRA